MLHAPPSWEETIWLVCWHCLAFDRNDNLILIFFFSGAPLVSYCQSDLDLLHFFFVESCHSNIYSGVREYLKRKKFFVSSKQNLFFLTFLRFNYNGGLGFSYKFFFEFFPCYLYNTTRKSQEVYIIIQVAHNLIVFPWLLNPTILYIYIFGF